MLVTIQIYIESRNFINTKIIGSEILYRCIGSIIICISWAYLWVFKNKYTFSSLYVGRSTQHHFVVFRGKWNDFFFHLLKKTVNEIVFSFMLRTKMVFFISFSVFQYNYLKILCFVSFCGKRNGNKVIYLFCLLNI
jgi:hypothetical protein